MASSYVLTETSKKERVKAKKSKNYGPVFLPNRKLKYIFWSLEKLLFASLYSFFIFYDAPFTAHC